MNFYPQIAQIDLNVNAFGGRKPRSEDVHKSA